MLVSCVVDVPMTTGDGAGIDPHSSPNRYPAECKRPDGNALNGQSVPTHIVPGRLRPRIRRPTLADPLRRTLNDRVLPFFENSTASCAVPGAHGSRQARASHELDLAVEDIDHTPRRVAILLSYWSALTWRSLSSLRVSIASMTASGDPSEKIKNALTKITGDRSVCPILKSYSSAKRAAPEPPIT